MRFRSEKSIFRKKMYKSGKMLVIAGSLSIIGTTSFLQQAHADVTSGDQAVIVAAATADK
ncbi:KxYKxGKxW signal peptide domain-containing protein, partial [Leuconostoc litchii]